MRWLLVLLATVASAESVPTSQYDRLRTAANNQESVLTPANVASVTKLGAYAVDGAVWAQPLVAQDIQVGSAYVDLLLSCTMHDSCYAFDSSQPTSAPLWRVSVGASLTTYPDNGGNILYGKEVGCLADPVVDLAHWAMFAVCATTGPSWVLNKISLTNGALLSSVTITGQVPGTGDPIGGDSVSGGILSFASKYELARAGLVLNGGNVYVAFSSYGDFRPYHGWVFSYSADTLTQQAIFCTSPNGYGASIWQSGSAPAVDSAGNLYLLTSNGDYDGVANFGESLVKLSPTLQLLDWFTPSNYAALSAADFDLSSGRALLIPGTNLVTWGFKDANLYAVDAGCLGHLQGSTACGLQKFATNPALAGPSGGIYGGGAFSNGVLYVPTVAGPVYAFTLSGSTWSQMPAAGASAYLFPGAQLTYSSNSGQNGILWALTAAASPEDAPAAGVLRALNPATLAEYWNSGQFGTLAKFAPPTVANGRIYVSTLDNSVIVYGLAAPAGSVVTVGGNGLVGGQGAFQ